MSKKSQADNIGDATETSEASLAALTRQITEFVQEGAFDSRFAAKLTKRLKKEAESISESGRATKPGMKELKTAFDALDGALRDHDAKLLVTANALLRASDEVSDAKR